jgi:hypothetical protein
MPHATTIGLTDPEIAGGITCAHLRPCARRRRRPLPLAPFGAGALLGVAVWLMSAALTNADLMCPAGCGHDHSSNSVMTMFVPVVPRQ